MEDDRPNVLCNTCKLYLVNRAMYDGSLRKIPVRFSRPIIQNTRLSIIKTVNLCSMCIESSRSGLRNRAPLHILHEKPGRPMINSPKKNSKFCSKCLSTIRHGFAHNCSKDVLINNSQLLLEQKRSIESVVGSEILRKFSSDLGEDSSITKSRPTGGHPIHILLRNSDQLPRQKVDKLDFSDIAQIICTGGTMSNRQF